MTELIESAQPAPSDRPANGRGEIDTVALTRSAGRGALWNLGGGLWQTVVRLSASTVLARVLTPTDFGILGMAMLALTFIQSVGALAMNTGIIAKKQVDQDDLCTAFWTNAGVQLFLFVATFAAAPLVASFFRTPELTWVVRAVSITFLFSAASSVSATLLRRRLQFGPMIIINGIGAVTASGLAIVFSVLFNLRYWSLVLASVTAEFVMASGRVLYARWRPTRRFSRASFRYLFRYGINGLGESITNYFHHNVDYWLVGRLLGAKVLGLYEFAYRIPHLLHIRVARPVGSVVFPTLSKVQANDDQLMAGCCKAAKYIAFLTFPALGGLAALARPTVRLLWGDAWLPVVLPLQILCFVAAVRSAAQPVNSIFFCKNRPDIPFKFGLARLGLTVTAVGTLAYLFGLPGVAVGMAVSVLPTAVILWLALRLTGSSWMRLVRAMLAPAASAGLSSLAAFGARMLAESFHANVWQTLLCSVPTGVIVYVIAIYVVFPKEAADMMSTARILVGRKPTPPSVKP